MAQHRGVSEYRPWTENTYRAAVGSWRAGADFVELDVRWTRDGDPMLMHDATVDRTTDGTGPLSALTSRQVRRLHAADGQRVPYAGTVVRAAARAGRGVVLEVKTRLTRGQAGRLARIVRDAGMARRTVFTVWNDHNAAALEALLPAARTARYDPTRRWRREVGHADLYVLSQRSLTADNVAMLARRGVGVVAPTVWVPGATTLPEAYAALNRLGVELVITSEARWYASWRSGGCP
jgi:glycerophosphoryl diester phosphodiesterase